MMAVRMPFICNSEMTKALKYSILAVFFFLSVIVNAQTDSLQSIQADTIKKEKNLARDPKTAALLSAVLPGTGQLYNRKYWKAPIVYAAAGTATFFIVYNYKNYAHFRDAYIMDYDTTDALQSEYLPLDYTKTDWNYITSQERTYADRYQGWLEYSYIAFGAIYALQILDATVDAHLSTFDVGPDLTLRALPQMRYARNHQPILGLNLSLTF